MLEGGTPVPERQPEELHSRENDFKPLAAQLGACVEKVVLAFHRDTPCELRWMSRVLADGQAVIFFKFIDDETETIWQVDLSAFSSYSMSPFLAGGYFINLHHAVAATCEKGDMMIAVELSK